VLNIPFDMIASLSEGDPCEINATALGLKIGARERSAGALFRLRLGPEMIPVIDTRQSFRPLCRELVARFRELRAEDWERPTLAGTWLVRAIVRHLSDTALRRLSFDRDGKLPLNPPRPIRDERDLATFINDL